MKSKRQTGLICCRPAVLALSALLMVAWFGSGCAHIEGEQEETAIVVPSTATSAPEYRGDGSHPPQRHVVRMSDGQRDWEVEFPDTARGYEMRVPLRDGSDDMRADHHSLTRADKELIEHLRRTDPDFEREGLYLDGEHAADREARRQRGEDPDGAPDQDVDPDERSEADAAPTRPSYFRGIEQVQRLFESGHYEAAMIQLSDLADAYPNDERVHSMKGTLWLRLGRENLARESWEQVLQINPDNEPVQEALQRLEGDPGAGGDRADDDFDEFDDE